MISLGWMPPNCEVCASGYLLPDCKVCKSGYLPPYCIECMSGFYASGTDCISSCPNSHFMPPNCTTCIEPYSLPDCRCEHGYTGNNCDRCKFLSLSIHWNNKFMNLTIYFSYLF